MIILAVDAATEVLSVALSAGGRVWTRCAEAGLRHSELLMPAVDALVREAGLQPRQIELAACMEGPGSFTGVRIGFATVKGIAAALGIPFAAVPTLDCMARPLASEAGLVVPAIDAKKGRFFSALYRGGARISPFLDAAPEEIAAQCTAPLPLILTGPAAPLLAARLPERLRPQCRLCTKGWAEDLLALAEEAYTRSGPPAEEPGPLYLRKSDAELHLTASASTRAGQ